MFICIHCDKKDRDFLNQAIALTTCDCCHNERWCIYAEGGY